MQCPRWSRAIFICPRYAAGICLNLILIKCPTTPQRLTQTPVKCCSFNSFVSSWFRPFSRNSFVNNKRAVRLNFRQLTHVVRIVPQPTIYLSDVQWAKIPPVAADNMRTSVPGACNVFKLQIPPSRGGFSIMTISARQSPVVHVKLRLVNRLVS